VAAGEPLPCTQAELAIHGHAFEVRVYAEDPARDFLPVTGRLAYLEPPEESAHVRVDTGVVQGDEIGIHYDPMIAKLVAFDETRERALARLQKALTEYRIGGLTTNLAFLHSLVSVPAFGEGEVHTAFIEEHRAAIFHERDEDVAAHLPLAALFLLLERDRVRRAQAGASLDPHSPWHLASAWRIGEPRRHRLELLLDGTRHRLDLEEVGEGSARRYVLRQGERSAMLLGHLEGSTLHATVDGHRRRVTVVPNAGQFTLFDAGGMAEFALASPDFGAEDEGAAAAGFSAPMNGAVVALLVEPGQDVEKGDTLMVMEAMKMEHAIRAPAAGRVTEFFFKAGELVDGGAQLLAFEVAP
jgi:3-methylcrotonyl-CoA carboxylase alpha subunit